MIEDLLVLPKARSIYYAGDVQPRCIHAEDIYLCESDEFIELAVEFRILQQENEKLIQFLKDSRYAKCGCFAPCIGGCLVDGDEPANLWED